MYMRRMLNDSVFVSKIKIILKSAQFFEIKNRSYMYHFWGIMGKKVVEFFQKIFILGFVSRVQILFFRCYRLNSTARFRRSSF